MKSQRQLIVSNSSPSSFKWPLRIQALMARARSLEEGALPHLWLALPRRIADRSTRWVARCPSNILWLQQLAVWLPTRILTINFITIETVEVKPWWVTQMQRHRSVGHSSVLESLASPRNIYFRWTHNPRRHQRRPLCRTITTLCSNNRNLPLSTYKKAKKWLWRRVSRSVA